MRAAFKAVMDGYQVAVLVPTTVLAQQHERTFRERLAAFPARVEVLSRFRTDQEAARRDRRRRKAGEVDIVIGTHRMLQQDVEFANLGLVIIDEEQRFGVTHKERLKRMRLEVDVLTLSATPIPRTLHMSLAGIRDMSTIEDAARGTASPCRPSSRSGTTRSCARRCCARSSAAGRSTSCTTACSRSTCFADRLRELVPEATHRRRARADARGPARSG